MYRLRTFVAAAAFVLTNSAAAQPAILQIGVCQPILLNGVNAQWSESLGPVGLAMQQAEKHLGVKQDARPNTAVVLQSPPTHGRIVVVPPLEAGGWPDHQYLGQPGYSGKDRFVFVVSLEAGEVKLVYHTQVVVGEAAAAAHCQETFGRSAWRVQ